jgi:hypothetical protein
MNLRRVVLAAALAAGLLATGSGAQPDCAGPSECAGRLGRGDREGWALHDGTIGRHAPDPRFSYNSSGATNELDSGTIGRFKVTLPNLGGLDGNVQVVAYGDTRNRCKIEEWSGMPDLTVDILCQDAAGWPVYTPFLVYFCATDDTATSTRAIGYARYDWSPLPDPPDHPEFQWNSHGPPPATTRLAVGRYIVRFLNMNQLGGAGVVTALGTGPQFCLVRAIGHSAGTDMDTEVAVDCYGLATQPADSSFTLRYEWQRVVAGAQALEGYAFAHSSLLASYTPAPSFNSTGATILAARMGTGTYALTYEGLPAPGEGPDPHPEVRASTVLLSAWSQGPSYCKVVSWGGSDDATTVNTQCFHGAGGPANLRYQGVYLTRPPAQPPTNP